VSAQPYVLGAPPQGKISWHALDGRTREYIIYDGLPCKFENLGTNDKEVILK